MKIEPEVLFDKLASLGSKQEIFDYCAEAGIQGERQEESSCVLAALFMRDTDVAVVKVAGQHIQWSKSYDDLDDYDLGSWGEQRALTSAMEVFIREFDSGAYPILEQNRDFYD